MLKSLFAAAVVGVRVNRACSKAAVEVLYRDGGFVIPLIKDITTLLKEAKELFVSSGLKEEVALLMKEQEELNRNVPPWVKEADEAVEDLAEVWQSFKESDEDSDEVN